ncbi:hypothetical protein EXIGLDRAFT_718689 [Exidia glandulosa HHB12029]|uniref:Uncharacterized protein n=1 Tax=Exidia glandulosa HHB12029 TaxID=1314781 RepID=A0A165HK88_EXIGL|nr:hypothetical protein EXIGLDRAFT_718689 [Exidia glandulosa HHB12029]
MRTSSADKFSKRIDRVLVLRHTGSAWTGTLRRCFDAVSCEAALRNSSIQQTVRDPKAALWSAACASDSGGFFAPLVLKPLHLSAIILIPSSTLAMLVRYTVDARMSSPALDDVLVLPIPSPSSSASDQPCTAGDAASASSYDGGNVHGRILSAYGSIHGVDISCGDIDFTIELDDDVDDDWRSVTATTSVPFRRSACPSPDTRSPSESPRSVQQERRDAFQKGTRTRSSVTAVKSSIRAGSLHRIRDAAHRRHLQPKRHPISTRGA